MPARLLIVDDHEVVRLGVRMLFAKDDSYEVCGEAQNGVEAIRTVSELLPDLVILGLSMPGMNGFEIAARIRLIAPSTRVVFFSGHEIPATARSVGADAFVSKSCPLQELARTVNRVMHLRTWGNTTRRAHPEIRRARKLASILVRPELVVVILFCQLNPQSDAVNHELICHRSCGFVPSTRTCFQKTAQPSMFHRTGCILQLRKVITPRA